ncbi:hypothetical protein E2562_007280 [Oryza meyeriana var. granulata]|uniref:Uncharacterized protein n=1 Tax=Oryza meyeriana var. granulata TaxID=110450 RepID=A0A6G1CFB1_9ORYZ|nr:hypothetical protein E2562_007280 [Oryza meyeriana var. granulata]
MPPLVVKPPPCSSSARAAACTQPSHAATSTTRGRLSVTPERRGSTLPRLSRSPAPPHRRLSLSAVPQAAISIIVFAAPGELKPHRRLHPFPSSLLVVTGIVAVVHI